MAFWARPREPRRKITSAAIPVTGVTLHDWEDIAIDDKGHLFIGDIGNNDANRDTLAVYEIDEPNPAANVGPDGTLLGLVAKNGAYVFRTDGDVACVIEVKPHHTKLKDEHIEGCCFVPDALLATSEWRTIFLFTDPAFRGQ